LFILVTADDFLKEFIQIKIKGFVDNRTQIWEDNATFVDPL